MFQAAEFNFQENKIENENPQLKKHFSEEQKKDKVSSTAMPLAQN
jgi:hypothetical protein